MQTTARARKPIDSEADVETQLYARPAAVALVTGAKAKSGVQRAVRFEATQPIPSSGSIEVSPFTERMPPTPSRVIEVKAPVRRRALPGLNVFLMPSTLADPAPPWSLPAPTKVALPTKKKRTRWALLALVLAVAVLAVVFPKQRAVAITRARPYAARGWTATSHAAGRAWSWTKNEWRAVRH